MARCPHCKQDGIALVHIDRCPDNPPIHAAIRAVLTDPADPRYAIGSDRYGMIAAAHGVPAETTLIVHYGSWTAAVDAFDLLRASAKPRVSASRTLKQPRRDTLPCRHCGGHYRAGLYLDNHESACPLRPETMRIVRSLVEDADNPGVGVSGITYDQRRVEYNAQRRDGAPLLPASRAFLPYFSEWATLLHHFGLVAHDEAIEAKTAADNARYRAAWQEHHKHELDPWGLPVASIQKPVPMVRILPDGRKATTIR